MYFLTVMVTVSTVLCADGNGRRRLWCAVHYRRILAGELFLQFLFEMREDGCEFIPLFGADPSERNAECLSLDPPDRDFIDPKRPVQPWDIQPALKPTARLDCHVTFYLASANRYVERSPLAFLLPSSKRAAQLCREPRLDTPFMTGLFAGCL